MMPINKETIREYADKYDKAAAGSFDEYGEKELKEWFVDHKYLDKEHFVRLGRWKSRRPTKYYENNNDRLVRDITKLSLLSEDEEVRIKILFTLKGVSWPVASTILHFAFPGRYSILDFRALWSLGIEQPKSYSINFWLHYCEKVREIAKSVQEDIRTVDKALWRYSKENQNIN